MSTDRKPFADAERFVLEGEEGGEQTWVVLAITELEGKDYALLAQEMELGGTEGDMDVVVFEYERGEEGTKLGEVSDEALYERAYHELASLMGIEESVEN